MDRDSVTWKGYWPACPTPFHADQSLDLDSFRALLEWYIGQGMHGIFVNGTSGEWFSQTPEERRLVAETAIELEEHGLVDVARNQPSELVAIHESIAEHAVDTHFAAKLVGIRDYHRSADGMINRGEDANRKALPDVFKG